MCGGMEMNENIIWLIESAYRLHIGYSNFIYEIINEIDFYTRK